MNRTNHNKPKILILGKIPPPYMGPSIATQILLNSALNTDFKLIHLDTRLNKNLIHIGKASLVKALRLLKQYLLCLFILAIKKPHIILVPISQSAAGYKKDAVFIRLGRLFKTPTLLHLRGSNFLNFYKISSPKLQRRIQTDINRCAGAIVLGEKLRYIFEPFLPKTKIYVVPNGANYSLSSSVHQFTNSSNQEFKLIYLGNLQPSKGILDVIQAYIMLRCSEDTQLHIVGKWRDKKTMDDVFQILHASKFKQLTTCPNQFINPSTHKQIIFHSVLHGQSKLDLLVSCDLLLFPPREPEGHPWVIVEAMAAGLPIIATDQGAITESVIDTENGFIVKPNYPEYIQDKIEWFINNPDQLMKMGKNSRIIYAEKFTEEKMVENLKKVFKSILHGV